MPVLEFRINGEARRADVPADLPVLWLLRDFFGLLGTKNGCELGQCGACTIHLDGKAVQACQVDCASAAGKELTTIEGVSKNGLHVVQKAFLEEDVIDCGYCVPGQVMSVIALLTEKPKPTDPEIEQALRGNLCRCGLYNRVKRAVHRAAGDQVK